MVKYPRLPNSKGYTTGDNQEWTYAYTLEDLNVCNEMQICPSEEIPTMQMIYKIGMLRQFLEHPEHLIGSEGFRSGSAEVIKNKVNEKLEEFRQRFGERTMQIAIEKWNEIVSDMNDGC